MKKLFLLLFLAISSTLSAQNLSKGVFVLDKMPAEGVSLDSCWKFHQGDNFQWTSPSFDDSGWQSINPIKGFEKLDTYKDYEFGWLRLKLKVAEAVRGQQLALSVNQHGASEIYLNGKLIQKYGVVSDVAAREKDYTPNNRLLS
jgi:two-component system NtrC family sensor kinase